MRVGLVFSVLALCLAAAPPAHACLKSYYDGSALERDAEHIVVGQVQRLDVTNSRTDAGRRYVAHVRVLSARKGSGLQTFTYAFRAPDECGYTTRLALGQRAIFHLRRDGSRVEVMKVSRIFDLAPPP